MRNFRCWLGHSFGPWIKGYADVGKNRVRWVRVCSRCLDSEAIFTDAGQTFYTETPE